jgi:hypothetical protein
MLLGLLFACGDPGRQTPPDGDVPADDATDAPITVDAPANAFTAAPAAVSFTAPVTATTRNTVVFTNTAASASAPVTLTVGGANASVFAVETSTCTGALGAGATCSARVAFTPTAATSYAAHLTLTDGISSVVVGLTGIGTTATGLTVSPALKDFGAVGVGATSSYFSFIVTNTGSVPAGALGLAFDTGATGDYLLATNPCADATLAAQATCTFSVGFKPTVAGTRTATLQVTDAASGGQTGISVTGVGVIAGGIVISPAMYDFGAVNVGDSAFAHQFTVTNTGTVTTGVLGTVLGGTNLGDFLKMADNCTGQTLAPGLACTLFIAFEPGAAGARTAHITVAATPGGSADADLSGTGQ